MTAYLLDRSSGHYNIFVFAMRMTQDNLNKKFVCCFTNENELSENYITVAK